LHKARLWVCTHCFKKAGDIHAGQWREDLHGRIFRVTKHLHAHYPFGTQRLPKLSKLYDCVHTRIAASLLFESQRDDMFKLVTLPTTIKLINTLARQYVSKSNRVLTYDETYDLVLTAAMRAASLYKPELNKPFEGYLWRAANNTFKKVVSGKYLQTETEIPENELGTDLARIASANKVSKANTTASPLEEKLAIDADILNEQRLNMYWRAVVEKIGAEDWYIFTSWVIGGKTQAQLGQELGIAPQAMSMRMRKVFNVCRQLEYILKTG
jgi:hypothetical protein